MCGIEQNRIINGFEPFGPHAHTTLVGPLCPLPDVQVMGPLSL